MRDLAVISFHGYALAVLLVFGCTRVERKQAAIMSDRIGANRAYVHSLHADQARVVGLPVPRPADGIKMMLKEDFRPNSYDCFLCARTLGGVHAGAARLSVIFRRHAGSGQVAASVVRPVRRQGVSDADRARRCGPPGRLRLRGLTIIGTMLSGWSSSNSSPLR